MKRAVKGFRFDTERSIKIGSYTTPLPEGNFEYWTATLYRTKTARQYFLVGLGMHMTRFAASKGAHVWDKGSTLTPLTRKAAYEWAEAYLAPDIFMAEFGETTKQMYP
jgi:hypothetical protein